MGYDVWYANDRGTRHSAEHDNRETMSLAEYWDFDFTDMAIYDIPVQVELILRESGMDKVTYVGYSQGTAQMFYALAKNQDFYADKINRFVAIGPCPITYTQ